LAAFCVNFFPNSSGRPAWQRCLVVSILPAKIGAQGLYDRILPGYFLFRTILLYNYNERLRFAVLFGSIRFIFDLATFIVYNIALLSPMHLKLFV
jgi:hypothetical protein